MGAGVRIDVERVTRAWCFPIHGTPRQPLGDCHLSVFKGTLKYVGQGVPGVCGYAILERLQMMIVYSGVTR